MDKQVVFDEFMNEFIKLTPDQKSHEILEKEKVLLAFLINYAESHDIPYTFLKSKEINDVLGNNSNTNDNLEALMVYTHNIEEIIGNIINNKR